MRHPFPTIRSLAPVLAALTLAAFLATGPALAADSLWLHVKVDSSGDSEKVTVNIPLTLVEKALPMIPEDAIKSSRLVLEEQEFSLEDLRSLWAELQSKPDFTMVQVRGDKENVDVKKEGEYLLVQVREEGDSDVDVRIPTRVVDALLSGEGEELNLTAALQALAAHGQGELVTVNEEDEQVRIWIDDVAEGR